MGRGRLGSKVSLQRAVALQRCRAAHGRGRYLVACLLVAAAGCARGAVGGSGEGTRGAVMSLDASADATQPDAAMDEGGLLGAPDAGPVDAGSGKADADASALPEDPIEGGVATNAGMEPVLCESTLLQCSDARSIGTVSGDDSAPGNLVQTTGTGTTWLRIFVDETSSSARALRYTARLSMDTESNYDLYIHESNDSQTPSCGGSPTHSSSMGQGLQERLANSWDNERIIPNGNEDGRLLSIEIRHVDGECGEWSLEVAGPTS